MLKCQDNGVSLLTTVRKKPEDTGKILGLVFPGLWHSVHIDDLRGSTVLVLDIPKLQDVAISQLFKPEDPPKGESGEKVLGEIGWWERKPGGVHSAARTGPQATVPQSNTCPLARARDTFAELSIDESRAPSAASKARRRQYFHKVFAGACGTCQNLFTLASGSAF